MPASIDRSIGRGWPAGENETEHSRAIESGVLVERVDKINESESSRTLLFSRSVIAETVKIGNRIRSDLGWEKTWLDRGLPVVSSMMTVSVSREIVLLLPLFEHPLFFSLCFFSSPLPSPSYPPSFTHFPLVSWNDLQDSGRNPVSSWRNQRPRRSSRA